MTGVQTCALPISDDINNASKIVMVSAIIAVVVGIAFVMIEGYMSMGGSDFIMGTADTTSPQIFYKIPSF